MFDGSEYYRKSWSALSPLEVALINPPNKRFWISFHDWRASNFCTSAKVARPGHYYVSFTFRYLRLVAEHCVLASACVSTRLARTRVSRCIYIYSSTIACERTGCITRTGRGFKPICNRERFIYIPLFCRREKCVDTDLFVTLKRRRRTLEFKAAFSIWSEFFVISQERLKKWRNYV